MKNWKKRLWKMVKKIRKINIPSKKKKKKKMEHTYCTRYKKYTGNSHIDSKRINNKVKLLKTKCLKCYNDKSMFLKQIHRQYKKKCFLIVVTVVMMQKALTQGQ